MASCEILTVADIDRLLVDNLHRIRQYPWDVIVHIPRSGTIPASILATYMARPMCSVEEYCAGMVSNRKSDVDVSARLLLVDDLARRGVQMAAAVQRIKAAKPKAKITTLAVYRLRDLRGQALVYEPDIALREVTNPIYMATWFLWKNKRLAPLMAVDFDGVLCRDCVKTEDYELFLRTAEPKFRHLLGKIGWIVTGRREAYRAQTEAWLKQHGYSYGKLLMYPNDAHRKRVSQWKGEQYKALTEAKLFVESSAAQSPIIADISGKTVWCVDNSRGYGCL